MNSESVPQQCVTDTTPPKTFFRSVINYVRSWQGKQVLWLLAALSVAGAQAGIALGFSRSPQGLIALGSLGNYEVYRYFATFAVAICSMVQSVGGDSICAHLLAPTRKEVDQAHSHDSFYTIGAVSMHNVAKKPVLRSALAAFLFLTSLPLGSL